MIEAVPLRSQLNAKKWLSLNPDLIAALEPLAEADGLSLSGFVSVLINEALAHRLHRRPLE